MATAQGRMRAGLGPNILEPGWPTPAPAGPNNILIC